MDFRSLTEGACGQPNSIVLLTQHVTHDLANQESFGITFTTGFEQTGLMAPQSFQMDDLMSEIQKIESRRNTSLVDIASNPWVKEDQTQYQCENSQIGWAEMNAPQEYTEMSFQNFLTPAFEFPQAQYMVPFYPQNEYHSNRLSQESFEYTEEFADYVTIESLDQIEDLEVTEDNCENLIEETELKESSAEQVVEPIVEFGDPEMFCEYLKMQSEMALQHLWRRDMAEISEIPKETLLDDRIRFQHWYSKELYECGSDSYAAGCEVLEIDPWAAIRYFDVAVQNDHTNAKCWTKLSYALLQCKEYEDALMAAKEALRIDPGNSSANLIVSDIYKIAGCKYQACQSIFNCLKYNDFYKFLIPADFEMNKYNNEKVDLHDDQLKAVKKLFFEAARLNPKNIDADLQIMISNLMELSSDLYKSIDCLRAALSADPSLDRGWLNLGALLFRADKPYEALDAYLKAAENDKHKITAYDRLGVVNMYLNNYRDAIHYFKKSLSIGEGYNPDEFEMKGDTLEAEHDFCLQMYSEIYRRKRN